jgi:hypothetical protein
MRPVLIIDEAQEMLATSRRRRRLPPCSSAQPQRERFTTQSPRFFASFYSPTCAASQASLRKCIFRHHRRGSARRNGGRDSPRSRWSYCGSYCGSQQATSEILNHFERPAGLEPATRGFEGVYLIRSRISPSELADHSVDEAELNPRLTALDTALVVL